MRYADGIKLICALEGKKTQVSRANVMEVLNCIKTLVNFEKDELNLMNEKPEFTLWLLRYLKIGSKCECKR